MRNAFEFQQVEKVKEYMTGTMVTSYVSEYIHEKRLRVSTGGKGQRVHDWDMIIS